MRDRVGLSARYSLSEDPNIMVGVIEAGPDLCGDPLVSSAGGWVATTHSPQYSWGFSSEPQSAAAGRTIPLARSVLLAILLSHQRTALIIHRTEGSFWEGAVR